MARILLEHFSRALIVESPHVALDEYLEGFSVQPHRVASCSGEDELIEALTESRAQILFKRSRVLVTDRVIQACPDLHAVQLCCIGSDSVDLEACARHGVLVFNDPISNGRSVVELAMGHMIALCRRLYETDSLAHAGRWEKNNIGRYEIQGKRLGIIGLGHIGRQVARVAESFGLSIWFYDTRTVAQEVGEEMGWGRAEDLKELFEGSDIVTVHTSARDAWGKDNQNFLDAHLEHLGANRAKESPRVFLNLARGNLYRTDSLLAAVRSGSIRRAAVDVYPDEPDPGQKDWNNPYADEPRIICTPHIGAATQEAQPRIAKRVALTMEQFSRFGSLRDCVFSPRVKLAVQDHARGYSILSVVHSVSRGTKKAIDDAIYEAGRSNLGSVHRDFPIGVAYDLSVLDRPLGRSELDTLVSRAADLAQDPHAIRAIRQIQVPG